MSPEKSVTSRREFVGRLGVGGISLGLMVHGALQDQIAYATQQVNRNSQPSDLKIVDLRVAVVNVDGRSVPIIRIDTNQGIAGYGEVRDGGSRRYALFLKSRLLGENPCNVEKVFRRVKQFGHHGRQGGGVSAVEMALWDLAGKAYGVPVYQMLGGQYRDRIRLYADTASVKDPETCAQCMKQRMEMGYTYLKMDLGIGLIRDIPVRSHYRWGSTGELIRILCTRSLRYRLPKGCRAPGGVCACRSWQHWHGDSCRRRPLWPY